MDSKEIIDEYDRLKIMEKEESNRKRSSVSAESYALHYAIQRSNSNIAKELLTRGININTIDNDGQNAIHWAAIHNDLDIIKLLLNKGIDVNTKDNTGKTPLQYAIAFGVNEAAQLLLNKGAVVDETDILLQEIMGPDWKPDSGIISNPDKSGINISDKDKAMDTLKQLQDNPPTKVKDPNNNFMKL